MATCSPRVPWLAVLLLAACPPAPSSPDASIDVTFDGVAIPPVDPDPNLMTPIWNYDLISNAVVFDARSVPEPGKTVRVSYRAACVP